MFLLPLMTWEYPLIIEIYKKGKSLKRRRELSAPNDPYPTAMPNNCVLFTFTKEIFKVQSRGVFRTGLAVNYFRKFSILVFDRFFNTPLKVSIQLIFTCSKSTIERCEICSKLTIKTPERRH